MPSLLETLPALYARLFPPFFQQEIPAETKATCGSCAMAEGACRNAAEPIDGASRLFRPDTKCCTFHPRLPNYLVGAILSDESADMAEGRRRIAERIDSRIGATPLWLRPPPKYDLLYNSASRAFGRAESLLCPYYERDAGSCSIWRHREAVCSTFYCKFVAGADGRAFWVSLKNYLSLAEIQLARHAVWKLHPDHILSGRYRDEASSAPLTAEDLDDRPPPADALAKTWGRWAGREAEYYRACYEAVRSLDAADLTRMMGLDGELDLAVLEQRRGAAVAPVLPKRLRFNAEATVKWMKDGSVALGAFSQYDAIALPGEAYALLVMFTGEETVDAVRQRMRMVKRADLDDEVLLALYRHRILTEA
jgi:Fe-S-cluster containining protein